MVEGDSSSPPPLLHIPSTSPFYVGPQDRPGDFITNICLKLANFNEWSHAIRIALCSRRKFGFLDGSIEVKSMLSNYDNAKKLWDDLHERFCLVYGPRIQQIKSEINSCEQTKTMSVAVYYSKLSVLWDELDKHEPLIVCTCGNCMCDVGKQHAARRDADRLQQFLLGLYSEYYAALSSNLLSQDPLPSLNKAFKSVAQDERQQPNSALGFAVHATATRKGRGPNGSSSSVPVCEKCNKRGHDISQCWNDKICDHCKKKGHVKSTCYELHGFPEGYIPRETRGVQSSTGFGKGSNPHANAIVSTASVPGSPVSNNSSAQLFTAEQWKAITGLFGNSTFSDYRLNGKFDSSSWIIDTGATHHVTGNKSWLFHVHFITCPVDLPNGETVCATLEGSVRLSDTITLIHVLYVPNLCCNLLSDQAKELIGMGVRRDGLFYFSKPDVMPSVSTVEASSSLELWHRRMGHPSERVVKLLPHVSNNKSSLNNGCEGPYRHVSSCGARYFLTIVDDYSRAV
ncbi:uncharacterized protein LOC130828642 [Amaranthus tricolor]|uniref:uncharacterized protein LOC130828642 n=1 Tax=Amaranthus tricolor TaxID=29722 RepID=UPI00258B539B|nr:uncharacterized protein LOC130828642 [Amaranthus tricolor]